MCGIVAAGRASVLAELLDGNIAFNVLDQAEDFSGNQ